MGGPALHVAYLSAGLRDRGYETALVAGSPEVRDDLGALKVAPPEKFAVIRLGIELDERVAAAQQERRKTRQVMGVPDDRFLVGWIGRMTGVKRGADVLRAFRLLRDQG